MFSNECATVHRLFHRLRTSVGPSILIFIGLTILHLLFRKYVTDVRTFWCDTDLAAVVIIIGIIDFFEGLLDEIRRLNEKLTEKEKIIQSQNAIVNKLTQELKLSKEQIKEKLRFHYQQSPIPAVAVTVSSYVDSELLEEIQQLRNQLLNRDQIIQQKNKALQEALMDKDLLEENFKTSDVQQLRQQILIKEKENIQQNEKHNKELKQLSKEALKLRKEISIKDVIICEINEKYKKLEETISKMNTVSYQNENMPRKQQPSHPSTPRRQILVHSNDICKTSQQQKKEEKGLELLQIKKLPLSNITNTMPSRERSMPPPPRRNFVEADDDLPPPPSILLYHTSSSSSSKFTTSTPTLHQMPHISSSSELPVKGTPPPIPPKPKPATSPPPAPQPPPPSLSFNKSFPATPSSSNISTPTKPPKSQQRTLNLNFLAEIQSSPKLKNLKEAEEERKKKEVEKSKSIQNNKSNFAADLKTQLSQRADKVNSTITDDEKENDDSDDEWEK